MLFTTPYFAVFLGLVFVVYWQIRAAQIRTIFLLAASYFFYGCWDWRFLGLIFFSSGVDFLIGRQLGKTQGNRERKTLLGASLAVNLGLLFVFKYYNFFVASFGQLLEQLGVQANLTTLSVILPVGISFYTFQTLSYTIDVYRRELEPTSNWIDFFAFVSFFPQLVAGPIERASALLPQFKTPKKFDYAATVAGLRQILWGLFKKIVIADQCAPLVNDIFTNYADYSAFTLVIGAVLFAFQIYCDFSGYSDIAIGTARLLGVDLMRNFAYPYFARDVAEFWRRWHTSLSTWFRDYLYIPLGGSRVSSQGKVLRNVFVVFLVSGLWHGANWTYLAWGLLHALFFVPLILTGRNRRYLDHSDDTRTWPALATLMRMLGTFALVCLAWVFFRAASITEAMAYLGGITELDLNLNDLGTTQLIQLLLLSVFIAFQIVTEWRWRRSSYPYEQPASSVVFRWGFYLFIGAAILVYGGQNNAEFIYFQF